MNQEFASENKPGPKDVFMLLLEMVLFYLIVISFLILAFQSINILVSDPLQPYAFGSIGGVRWGVAALIVAFPIYFYLTRYLVATYRRDEVRKDMKTRKWLTYLTLFAAAVTFIITLIMLLYNLLQGELSLRFGLKVLSVFVVAALGFWYYQQQLRNVQASTRMQVISGTILVLAAVVGGIWVSATYVPKVDNSMIFPDIPPPEQYK